MTQESSSVRKLTPDIKALVHHIELNEAGWMELALSKAVRFLIWMHAPKVTMATLFQQRIQVGLGQMTQEAMGVALDKLIATGDVIAVGKDTFHLSVAAASAIDESIGSAEGTEAEVRKKVLQAAVDTNELSDNVEFDPLWAAFRDRLVVPFITEFGARAYELMTGLSTNIGQSAFIQEYLKSFPDREQSVLEAMMLSLLDKMTSTVERMCSDFLIVIFSNPPSIYQTR